MLRKLISLLHWSGWPMSGRKSFKMRLDKGIYARAITAEADADADEVRNRLRLPVFKSAITVHAGADNSTAELVERLEPLFAEQVAPLADKYHIPIIDGATASGFVGMMGRARERAGATFPLIGIMPLLNAPIAKRETGSIEHPIEPNHTHLVLVKGGEYGIESDLLIRLGRVLATRTVALIVNGGEIVRHEARLNARIGNPILVLEGSGRLADELVDALKRGTNNDLLRATIQEGSIYTCTPESLIPMLKLLLALE